jgi:hypothetical protein
MEAFQHGVMATNFISWCETVLETTSFKILALTRSKKMFSKTILVLGIYSFVILFFFAGALKADNETELDINKELEKGEFTEVS